MIRVLLSFTFRDTSITLQTNQQHLFITYSGLALCHHLLMNTKRYRIYKKTAISRFVTLPFLICYDCIFISFYTLILLFCTIKSTLHNPICLVYILFYSSMVLPFSSVAFSSHTGTSTPTVSEVKGVPSFFSKCAVALFTYLNPRYNNGILQ